MFKKSIGILAALSILGVGACNIEPAFDYDTATHEEREVWLTKRAEAMSKGFTKGINRFGSSRFDVSEPKIDVSKRLVTLTARIRMRNARLTGNKDKFRNDVLEQTCPKYVRTQFYRQNIRVVQRVLHQDKSTALVVTQSPSSCDRTIDRMNRKKAGA